MFWGRETWRKLLLLISQWVTEFKSNRQELLLFPVMRSSHLLTTAGLSTHHKVNGVSGSVMFILTISLILSARTNWKIRRILSWRAHVNDYIHPFEFWWTGFLLWKFLSQWPDSNLCPACSFDLWRASCCLAALFETVEWKENVSNNVTSRRWFLGASNASFNLSSRLATRFGCWIALELLRHIRDSGQVSSRHPCAPCHSNSGILSLSGIFSHYM